MFATFILAIRIMFPVSPAATCETVGPRLDGISVVICGGRVVRMTDASGLTAEYPYSR